MIQPTTNISVTRCPYPVVHEQVLHNEVGHERFERGSELLRGQLSQVAQCRQWRDKLLQVGGIQALVQRLRKHRRRYACTQCFGYELVCSGSKDLVQWVYLTFSTGLTDLKDLSEVCIPIGEHGIDAVDGVLGLPRGSPLGFSLQYRQQDTEGSQRDKDNYKVSRP